MLTEDFMQNPKTLIAELLATGMRATRIAEGADIPDAAISKIMSGKQTDLYASAMFRLMEFHKTAMRRHFREQRKLAAHKETEAA
jgi:predicted transcriptional regulator